MDIKKLFGNAVKEYRIRRDITQEMLAELSDLNRNYISGVEQGARNISLVNIQKICCGLNVKMSELFSLIEKNGLR